MSRPSSFSLQHAFTAKRPLAKDKSIWTVKVNIFCAFFSIVIMVSGEPAQAISINDQIAASTPGGVTNYYDSSNSFPNVLSLLDSSSGGSYCSGSLINSRTVLTAAHCFYTRTGQWSGGPTPSDPQIPIPAVSAAPLASLSEPNARSVSSIFVNRDYDILQNNNNDIALISLSQPITNISPVLLVGENYTAPTSGAIVTIVGYGDYGTGSSCCSSSDNRRRIATTEFGEIRFENGQPYIFAQFRNPLSPNNPNDFNVVSGTSALEGGTNPGDSGGPIFVQIDGRLFQIGQLRGGFNNYGPEGQYGDISDWTPVNIFSSWITTNNPQREVSANAGSYVWSNNAAWRDSMPGVSATVPNNTVGNVSDYQTGVARYFNVSLDNKSVITLDTNPTIDRLTISNREAKLIIPQARGLSIVSDAVVSAGALNIDGVLTTPRLTAINQGFINGVGTISGDVYVRDGGVLEAGALDAIGKLTISGNVFFSRNPSFLDVDVTRNAIDFLEIDGSAYLGGSVRVHVAPEDAAFLAGGARGKMVSASGGATAVFDNVAFDRSLSFLTPDLSYTDTDVYLSFALTPFSLAAKNINQRNVGNALTIAALGPVNALGAPILNAMFLGDYANAQAVMDTVSGSGLAGVQSTSMQVGQMASSAVSDQIAFWRSGETQDATGITSQEGNNARNYMAYAPAGRNIAAKGPIRLNTKGDLVAAVAPRTFRAWGSMFGGGANFQTDAGRGAAASTVGFYGGLIGLDYQLTPNLLVGVALGGSSASFSVGSLSTNGALTGFHAGLYGAYTMGASYVALNETFSAWDNQTTRKAGGYALMPYEQLTAGFGSTEFRTRLEAGHGIPVAGIKATPFIAAEIAAYQTNGFTERSSAVASTFALKNNGQAINSLPTFVGVRLSDAFTLANGWRLAPIGSVAYVHEFFPQRQFTNILTSMPGAEFNVSGPRSTFNLVQTKLGAQLNLTNQLALYSDFQGEFSYVSQSYGGKAGMKYWW